ncbi:MAG TPA: MmgE/PrpD family protein [Acidiphilium sp.]
MTTLADFIHDMQYADLPSSVLEMARTCILDLVGVAAAGRKTGLSQIAHDHAARHFAASPESSVRLMFDGRRASAAGAAFAGAATIDSFDAHDGHPLTKGHAGVAVLPAALAFFQYTSEGNGKALLADMVIGYEIAIRAGMALHATACDYHTSGAWNAMACAALGSRRLELGEAATRHALGIAEYHGPRSQMMRCIDHPTMVKDGSAWGALAGVSAALLAADGFTGAPALLAESADVAGFWSDLGSHWRVLEQYFKPYPVCRWAQPAVEAAVGLQGRHNLDAAAIAGITISSFDAAVRLACRRPATTEEAQYSLPFPVAAALVRGSIGAADIGGTGLADPDILRLSDMMVLETFPEYERLFPEQRWAHVTFHLADGRTVTSEPALARGNAENPLSPGEMLAKYRALASPVLGEKRAALIETMIDQIEEVDICCSLAELLAAPATPHPAFVE